MNLDLTIQELRSRNESVPVPARLPMPSEVDAAEKKIGIPFPTSFRHYLLEASDVVCGTLEPVTLALPNSHTDLYAVFDRARLMGIPEGCLPLCEDNGDYYLMKSDGSILFWSHGCIADHSWPDLASWINSVWIH